MKFNQVTKAMPIYNAIAVLRKDITGLKQIEKGKIIRLSLESHLSSIALTELTDLESEIIIKSLLNEKEKQLKVAINELENI